MKTIIKLSFIALFIFLTACSSGGGTIPDKIYYRFAEPSIRISNNNIDKIERPTALGILGSRPMVAENAQGGMLQMNHNLWLESPKVLLQNYLLKVFNLNNENIMQKDGNTLSAAIIHLEKQQTTAIIEIKFTVKNTNDEIIFNKSYHQAQPMAENTIVDFVHVINQELAAITQQLSNDLP